MKVCDIVSFDLIDECCECGCPWRCEILVSTVWRGNDAGGDCCCQRERGGGSG